MPEKLRHYLELIRLPGLFTAHADILAGFLISGAGIENISGLFWLLGASSCFFSAGMALNDFFDADTDRVIRPKRPIPSGRITRKAALVLGMVLLGAGLVSAFFAGSAPFYTGLALTSTILLYDGVFKSGPAGPIFMGACRYFNLLMALALRPFEGWTLVPLVTFIYITGVTLLSRKEAEGGRAVAHIAGCATAVGLSASWAFLLFIKGILDNFTGIALLMGGAVFLSSRILELLDRHTPEDFQGTMKVLLMSLIALDFLLASARAPLYLSSVLLVLYIPALRSVRLFKVT